MRKRGLTIAACLLALTLVSGTAYAMTAGQIHLSGAVARNPRLDLELVSPAVEDIRPGESAELGPDQKTLSFSVVLVQPGDQRSIAFQIANTGNIAARLQNLTPQNPAPASGVAVAWPDLEDTVILPNQTTETLYTVVTWEPDAFSPPSGNVVFEAAIQYAQA